MLISTIRAEEYPFPREKAPRLCEGTMIAFSPGNQVDRAYRQADESRQAIDLLGFLGSVNVHDGDTIEVLRDNHAKRIRLSGIDCPEKGQVLSGLQASVYHPCGYGVRK